MKRILPLLLALATLLAPIAGRAADATAETMSERELKRIVQRQQTILAAAQAAGENLDRSNTELQLSEVVRDYESLLRKDPKCVSAYISYGLLLKTTGNAKRAFAIFKRAEALDPDVAVIKNMLGNHYTEEGDYREALKYYEGAIALAPKEPLYHYVLGMLLYEYREFFIDDKAFTREALLKRSAEAFAEAARLAPDNIAYVYRYAESFYDLPTPDWDAALATWKNLAQRAKPGVEIETIQLHQANILVQIGRADEARALLDQITAAPLQPSKQKLVDQLAGNTNKAP